MNSAINVRAARAEDKSAILAFCQNTFHWGDYIGDAWDGWLADSTGQMFVGSVDDKPVGLVHVKILEGGVGWLEGMRVHPDFRRHGISTALDRAGHNFARGRDCRVARLVTSEKNIAAQKTIATQGYEIIARFGEWSAQPAPGECARIATLDDAEKILE
ncbi:MAG: GNAT family N-acetyltransferase, partial [Chloroflexi bacterium]|nr:GNAT family N-acetyltransferase [Chloroflexota bacterium]